MAVCLDRRGAAVASRRIKQSQSFASAADGGSGNVVGMGKARHLARNAAQAKTSIARIIRCLQPAIVKAKSLAGDKLQIKLAIIAGLKRLADDGLRLGRV